MDRKLDPEEAFFRKKNVFREPGRVSKRKRAPEENSGPGKYPEEGGVCLNRRPGSGSSSLNRSNLCRGRGPATGPVPLKPLKCAPDYRRSRKWWTLGCGVGGQTLHLAEMTEAIIVAVDLHEPSISRLRETVSSLGLSERIFPMVGDMADTGLPPESFDLLCPRGPCTPSAWNGPCHSAGDCSARGSPRLHGCRVAQG